MAGVPHRTDEEKRLKLWLSYRSSRANQPPNCLKFPFSCPLSPLCALVIYFGSGEGGGVRYKANSPARCPNKAKIIFLLCLSAPPSFSNMKCSRYDFSSDGELGGCQRASRINQMPLAELSGAFCKKGADKNDSSSSSRRGGGMAVCRQAAVAAGTPRWTNYTLAQVYKYRKYCLHNHSK